MNIEERFRTLRISDPRFESDNLRFITIKTPNLKGRGNIGVFVPDTDEVDDLPFVILLHGVYGSALSWSQQGGAHRTARKLIISNQMRPMVLVMPSDGLWGDGSAYLPHNGFNFEKWIIEDVIDAVRLAIPQVAISTNAFITGLSMGGFGALKLGAKYPTIFKGVSAHSAITSLEQMALFVEEPLTNYHQGNFKGEEILSIMRTNRHFLPPIRFDCGKEDILIEPNRQLHHQLRKENIPHQYEEFKGVHEWAYWEEHLVDSLLFFEKILLNKLNNGLNEQH